MLIRSIWCVMSRQPAAGVPVTSCRQRDTASVSAAYSSPGRSDGVNLFEHLSDGVRLSGVVLTVTRLMNLMLLIAAASRHVAVM